MVFYLTDSLLGIDASRKGNLARYINHSCDPNCATRKWVVNGETRIGIFAIEDIKAGTELTFDYQFERIGGAKQKCLCGSEKCRGYLGTFSIFFSIFFFIFFFCTNLFLGAKAIELGPDKHVFSNHKKHCETILKNINWQNLELAITETKDAVIRNRCTDLTQPPIFLQRNYR